MCSLALSAVDYLWRIREAHLCALVIRLATQWLLISFTCVKLLLHFSSISMMYCDAVLPCCVAMLCFVLPCNRMDTMLDRNGNNLAQEVSGICYEICFDVIVNVLVQ